MVKTITISDEIYEMLVAIKGNRSFSEVIKSLIRGNVKWVLKFAGIGWEEDKKMKATLREAWKKWTEKFFA